MLLYKAGWHSRTSSHCERERVGDGGWGEQTLNKQINTAVSGGAGVLLSLSPTWACEVGRGCWEKVIPGLVVTSGGSSEACLLLVVVEDDQEMRHSLHTVKGVLS